MNHRRRVPDRFTSFEELLWLLARPDAAQRLSEINTVRERLRHMAGTARKTG